jgi:acetyl-CoA carboxylase biotin carboxyl carrier protein
LADDARPGSDPFDVRTIEALVGLMSQHGLSEIDLRHGEVRICLRRGPLGREAPEPLVPAPTHTPPAPQAVTSAPPATSKLIEIKSPAVGTFYAQPNPEAPPYVTKGSRVTPTTVVCQIEAMKIFNEIQAECSGVIVEVLAKNKDFVEYDTVLFRVDPNA